MTWLGSRLSRGVGRMALAVIATATAALLFAPGAIATPDSDASDAIDQAWQAAGGDGSPVGTKDGDVYAVGDGFAQNFSGGKIFFTPATGAHLLFGPILDKYQAQGGPADSDLGFPTIDEVAGLVGSGQPGQHVQRQRQTGDLLDARHRRVGGARRDQRGMGQARRLGRHHGRAHRRRDLRRQRGDPEVHRRRDLLRQQHQDVHHGARRTGRQPGRCRGPDRRDDGDQRGVACRGRALGPARCPAGRPKSRRRPTVPCRTTPAARSSTRRRPAPTR